MLTDQDFPGHYVNMAHPQDYIARSDPLQPELFYNRRANHFKLLLRASFALPDKTFLPMTFVCNTGAPGGYYFSERAMNVLSRADVERLKEDDLHNLYLQTEVGKFAVTDTPQRHQHANISGPSCSRKVRVGNIWKPEIRSQFQVFLNKMDHVGWSLLREATDFALRRMQTRPTCCKIAKICQLFPCWFAEGQQLS